MAPNTLKNLQNHRLNHLSQNVLLLHVVDSQILYYYRSCSITLPFSITATSSQILLTCISCVISTIVKFCCSLTFNNKSRISSVVCGSNALVASSHNNTSGSLANALAIPLCFVRLIIQTDTHFSTF